MRTTLALSALSAAMLLVAPLAQASVIRFVTTLSGATEVLPVVTPATGFAIVDYDNALHSLLVHVEFGGLIGGNAAAAHIHCCTAPGTNVGVAIGFPSFPSATSGIYDHLFDLTDPAVYTTAFRNGLGGGTAAGAEAALFAGMSAPDHRAYVNIHNAANPGGEIRGLLEIPEPSAALLAALALIGLAATTRKRLS